ncbi:MAG TPA: hypothetical protein VK578_13800 [Edaphobacter sp.]|nr:hypothetical protein [Edaphobacter sp.]
MAIDDDPLLLQVLQLSDDQSSIVEGIRDTSIQTVLIQTVLSVSLPYVGPLIAGLLGDIAQKRWNDRVLELLIQFAKRFNELRPQQKDLPFYESQEFQALLFESIDQERTNRFREKRLMLAEGLAKSGTETFILDENKETFLRILRDLNLEELAVLKSLAPYIPNKTLPHLPPAPAAVTVKPQQTNPTMYRLQGLGLISSRLEVLVPTLNGPNSVRDQGDFNKKLIEVLASGPNTVFWLNAFGRRFLAFLTEEQQDLASPTGGT